MPGLTGEMEVMEILRKHEEGSGTRRSSLEELKESIMKVIRAHIEQNKLPFPGGGGDQARLYLIFFRYVRFRSGQRGIHLEFGLTLFSVHPILKLLQFYSFNFYTAQAITGGNK